MNIDEFLDKQEDNKFLKDAFRYHIKIYKLDFKNEKQAKKEYDKFKKE